MAAKAKDTNAASETDASALPFDTAMYVPGPHDRAHTEIDGIKFVAGVATRIPRTRTTMQLVKIESTTADGTIVTRSIEKRVPFIEKLKTNPFFSVNGKPPVSQVEGKARLPQDPDHYRKWAMEWIHRAASSAEIEIRWSGESELRENCGVSQTELSFIQPFLDMKLEQLKSAEADTKAA